MNWKCTVLVLSVKVTGREEVTFLAVAEIVILFSSRSLPLHNLYPSFAGTGNRLDKLHRTVGEMLRGREKVRILPTSD